MNNTNEDYTIHINRGDELVITFANSAGFNIGDTFKLSITTENDIEDVLFQKSFVVEKSELKEFDIVLTSEDTRIGPSFKEGSKTYWYEIELNGNSTLIGCDENGGKKFILYPEAPNKETAVEEV
jgi:hypothetical protein